MMGFFYMNKLGRIFGKSFEGFLFGNWFISLSAVLLTLSSIKSLSLDMAGLVPVLALTGFGVLLVYSIHAIFTRSADAQSVRKRWINEYSGLLWANIIGSGIILLACIPFLKKETFFFLIPCALISVGYSARIRIGLKSWSLREVPYGKAFLVAGVWSLVSVLLPLFQAQQSFSVKAFVLIVIRFLLLWLLCFLFDIRDLKEDNNKGTRTLLMAAGIRNLRLLAYGGLFFICLLSYLIAETTLMVLMLFGFAGVWFITSASEHRGDYFYSLWGDGLILLYAVVALFSN